MRLVADANAPLSAVLGARLIVESPQVSELLTVERIAVKLQEYATFLARKKGLAEDVVLLALGTLPVTNQITGGRFPSIETLRQARSG